MKLIEKLYFIPTVHRKEGASGGSFRIVYEPIISNKESAKIINELENNLPENLFIKGDKPKDFVENFMDYCHIIKKPIIEEDLFV